MKRYAMILVATVFLGAVTRADDVGNQVWRVSASRQTAGADSEK